MAETSGISGTVLNQSNNKPIEGAGVEVRDSGGSYNASTDAKGKFAIEGLAPGETTMTISKPGFQEGIYGPLNLMAGHPMDLKLALEPESA